MTAPSLQVPRSPPASILTSNSRPTTPPSTITSPPVTTTPPPPPATPIGFTSLLPIRTPTTRERPRPRKSPSPEASPAAVYEFPTSTAPAELGREKRKRVHTDRYREARRQGLIQESQEAHKAEQEK